MLLCFLSVLQLNLFQTTMLKFPLFRGVLVPPMFIFTPSALAHLSSQIFFLKILEVHSTRDAL